MTRVLRTGAAVLALGLAWSAGPGALRAQEAVRGRVLDGATLLPIAEAEVVVAGGAAPARAFTGADGAFRLQLSPLPGARLVVRRLGYAPRSVPVGGAGADVVVTLTALPVALDAIVVTASRREQRLADAVVATELINRQDIERSGATDVAGVLTARTGIQLEGGVPSGAGVMLQGLGAQRVLVLLDGQPLVGRVNGNLDLSRVPSAIVERIEVVKGPQSTLYGSDALGGVVNIVTSRPGEGERRGYAASTAGSHGRRELSAGAQARRGRLAGSVDGGFRTVDLAPGIAGDAGARARRWHTSSVLAWRPVPAWTVEAAALLVAETQRYRTGQLYNFADNTQLNARAGATWQRGAGRFAPVLSWSRFDHLSRRATGPVPVSDSGAVDVQDLLQLEAPGSFAVGRTVVDAGVTLRRDAITADRVPGGTRVLHAAEPYAQATWNLGRLDVTPGARVSAHERWGTAVSPRLALLWRPMGGLSVRAAAGRGYRAPDFKELYLDFANPSAGYAVVGNPDLRPETAANLSLSVEWVGARVYLRAGAFDNQYRNFIETTDLGGGLFSYGNVARGSTRGLELESGASLGRLRLEGAYAWLRARDAVTNTPLPGRPSRSGRVAATVTAGRLRLGSTLQVTGRTPLMRGAAGAISASRAAFARLDVRGAAELMGSLELTAGVDNAFDRRLGDAWPGFTGRQVYVGARWGR